MMFAGTAMAREGDRPRHDVVKPSLRAIFLSPSSVELKVRCCGCSTAQSVAPAGGTPIPPILVPATQYSALLFIKKTSRQHAVTPRLDGRKVFGAVAASFCKSAGSLWKSGPARVICWDCKRTRTTSSGVTGEQG